MNGEYKRWPLETTMSFGTRGIDDGLHINGDTKMAVLHRRQETAGATGVELDGPRAAIGRRKRLPHQNITAL